MHNNCSGVRKISKRNTNYVCPRCNNASNYHSNQNVTVRINPFETLRTVVLLSGWYGFRWKWRNTCIIGQLAVFWTKWRQIAPLLLNKVIDFITKSYIYRAVYCEFSCTVLELLIGMLPSRELIITRFLGFQPRHNGKTDNKRISSGISSSSNWQFRLKNSVFLKKGNHFWKLH